jgi:MFS family permease
VTVNAERTAGVPASTMAALMLAVFTVSVGYGVVLPLLPYLIERLLGESGKAAQVARATGLLTGIYSLALFLFAPVWGRVSDRLGRRGVLLIGLVGFGATMLISSFVGSLTAVYAERFLSGMFSAAVTPVAAAAIADFATTEQERARRLAFVSMAGGAGFLLGPMFGVFISRFAAEFFTIKAVGSIAIPLAATALLAFLVGLAVAFAIPGGQGRDRSRKASSAPVAGTTWVVPKLLVLTFIVSAGIGVFEVGLALRGKQELGLTPYQIGLMFSECSLVMFVVQAIVFSPWVRPDTTRWIIAPALAVLAAALFLVPRASDFTLMLAVVGGVAASAGILSPILTYWISSKAGSAQGWELGKQTAAASLGITVGSVAGGLLFNVAALQGASFMLTAGLAVLGLLLSLGLPHLLVPRNLGDRANDGTTDDIPSRSTAERSRT